MKQVEFQDLEVGKYYIKYEKIRDGLIVMQTISIVTELELAYLIKTIDSAARRFLKSPSATRSATKTFTWTYYLTGAPIIIADPDVEYLEISEVDMIGVIAENI